MSILSITGGFDPLFDRMWRIWPQSWDRYGEWNEKYIRDFSDKLFKALISDGDYFDSAINQAVVAVLASRHVPAKEFKKIDVLTDRLLAIVRTIEPKAKYILIEYKSSVSGGDRCLPNIVIHFDSQWFGTDYNRTDLGPWNQRHSTCTVHITHNTRYIQGYQGCTDDARPMPRYSDLHPDYNRWREKSYGFFHTPMQDKYRELVVFPAGESNHYYKQS